VKKGCGFILAVWIALVGAYGYVAWQTIHEWFPAAMIGVLGGTFAGALVGSFVGLFTGARDRAALRRAIDGEPFRDGRLEAASGPIRPLDAPLDAPFTGRPCVAYEYDVKKPGADRSEFAGVALAPSAIDTGRGSVHVLGWAILDEFPAGGGTLDTARGTAYLQSARSEPLGLTSIVGILGDLLADDDGAIRKDFRIGPDTVDLQGRRIEERIVPVGAVVTMLGRWTEARRGFAPAGPGSINRLFPGELARTKQQVGGAAVKTFATGLFFFLALHAILVPIYFLAPKQGATTGSQSDSVWDERDCDRQRALLASGADPNEQGRDGLTPLMNAARQGEPLCVESLIAAGARLESADKDGDTALAQAVVAGREENVEILRAAGAKDFRVTEDTGRSLTGGSAPFAAVKDYIAAVHSGDFATMMRLRIGASLQLMEERRADLPFWQSLRPRVPILTSGWMTEEAATLTVHGTTPAGERRIIYHLENGPAGWRIRREWFPDLR
jgi:hypothetical protein